MSTEAETKAAPAPIVIDDLHLKAADLDAEPFSEEILAEYAAATEKTAPHLIRRGIFHAQIDFADAIARKKSGKPFYIFLSITPTDRLFNLRHVAMFKLARELQVAFNCQVVIHVLDTKACLRDPNPKVTMQVAEKMTVDTIKDILAFGFEPQNTIIVKNTDALALNYVYLCDLQRCTKLGEFYEKFFTSDLVSIAEIDAVFQNACFAIPKYLEKIFPNFADSRCLMLLRESQLSLFKFAKELSKENPPMAVFGGFVPALQSGGKMPRAAKIVVNKSVAYMTVYLKDKANEIKNKVNRAAFSGGKDSREEQEQFGANISVDVPYYYLRVFEEDDEVFDTFTRLYGPGELAEGEKRKLTGEVKKSVIDLLTKIITDLQKARDAVKPEDIAAFTKIRSLQ